MLIIPIEQKLDSNRPPVATVLLIIINCMVFFGYQSNDNAIIQKSIEYYQENNIYKYENVVYQGYLEKHRPEAIGEFKKLEEIEAIYWIIQDIEFTQYLNNDFFVNNTIHYQWIDARSELDTRIKELSFLKYGLIPGDFSVIDMFASMFLHGGIGHLLGNMLFLFIYGFSLEIALGRLWYLGAYMLSGLGGWLLVIATSPESITPTVGASGAVFGLLGMYLGLYGLKRIQFFFTVGFYVNYFKAPALVLLPYWGLIELYGQFAQNNNVAHFAHIGGLLAGFLFVYFAKNRLINIDQDYVNKRDSDEPFRKLYDKFLRQIENIDLIDAKKTVLMLLKMQPNNMRLLKHQFDLWKLKPRNNNFEKVAQQVFSQKKLKYEDIGLLVQISKEYESISEEQKALDTATRINLFNTFLKANYSNEAEQLLTKLSNDPCAQTKLPALLLRFANHLFANKKPNQAQNYISRIIEEFPSSEAANEARQFKHI